MNGFNISFRPENVRCFVNPSAARLAPLTILVGENSTGKSSFLALARILFESLSGSSSSVVPSFNKDPFFLGSFNQIAHYHGGRAGRATSFSLTLETHPDVSTIDNDNNRARFTLYYEKSGAQPVISAFEFLSNRHRIFLSELNTKKPQLEIFTPSGPTVFDADVNRRLMRFPLEGMMNLRFLEYFLEDLRFVSERQNKLNLDIKLTKSDIKEIISYWRHTRRSISSDIYAAAPVRTKPERTYDPIDDTPKSEGSHAPMLLSKLHFTDKGHWARVKKSLEDFGQGAGLFQSLRIKSLGRTESDPFQIMVKINGPESNLIDVGYGVSQVLPILVDMLSTRRQKIYLIQQPEVHLHPRGQAELGSFFANYAKGHQRTGGMVIVETHSDYLIDRVRADIRDKRSIKPSDVSILYFEWAGTGVQIHNLSIDEYGNLVGAPKTYRQFFLREQERFMGVSNVLDN